MQVTSKKFPMITNLNAVVLLCSFRTVAPFYSSLWPFHVCLFFQITQYLQVCTAFVTFGVNYLIKVWIILQAIRVDSDPPVIPKLSWNRTLQRLFGSSQVECHSKIHCKRTEVSLHPFLSRISLIGSNCTSFLKTINWCAIFHSTPPLGSKITVNSSRLLTK